MRAVLVDSNVLLDVMSGEGPWAAWSADMLASIGDSHRLFINAIIYAEVSVRFTRIEELDEVLPRDLVSREPIPYEAAFLAGKVFVAYRQAGGVRTAPLPDFFIGAHAAVSGAGLLTRDTARYRTYFPTVNLIAPDKAH